MVQRFSRVRLIDCKGLQSARKSTIHEEVGQESVKDVLESAKTLVLVKCNMLML